MMYADVIDNSSLNNRVVSAAVLLTGYCSEAYVCGSDWEQDFRLYQTNS